MDTTPSSSHRVPPGVEYEFEIVVDRVLQIAKPDYGNVVNLRVELLGALRERWREGIELGMTTEAAQEFAVEKFGNPRAVGDALREHWLKRLLYHERGKSGRWMLIVCAYIFTSMLTNIDILGGDFDDYEREELVEAMSYLLGTYLLVVYACIALLIIRLRLQSPYRLLRWVASIRYVLWFFPVVLLLNLLITPVILIWRFEPFIGMEGVWDFVLGLVILCTLPSCWLAAYAFWREVRAKSR